jgi:hypothetical protein
MAWLIEPIAVEAGAPSPTPARGPFLLAHSSTLPLICCGTFGECRLLYRRHRVYRRHRALDLTPLHPDAEGSRQRRPGPI